MAPILWAAIVMVAVCGLAILVILLARKAFGSGGTGLRARAPRLAILDVLAVDQRRKLVLVRRDEVEHLVLIGGQNDLVVEGTIQRHGQGARGEPAQLGRVDASDPRLPSGQPRQRPRVEAQAPSPSLERPPLPLPVQRPRPAPQPPRAAPALSADARAPRLDAPVSPPVPPRPPVVAATHAAVAKAPTVPAPSSVQPAGDEASIGASSLAETGESGAASPAPKVEPRPVGGDRMEAPKIEAPNVEAGPARPAPASVDVAPADQNAEPANLRAKPAEAILQPPRAAQARPSQADYPTLPRTASDRPVEMRPVVPPLSQPPVSQPVASQSVAQPPVPQQTASSPLPRATPVEPKLSPPMAPPLPVTAVTPGAEKRGEPQPPAHDGERERAELRAQMNEDPAGLGSVADLTAPTISIEKREPAVAAETERKPLSVTSFASAIQNRKGPSEMPSPPMPDGRDRPELRERKEPAAPPVPEEPSLEDFLSAELDSDFGNDSFFDNDTGAAPSIQPAAVTRPAPNQPQGVAASVLAALAARNRPAPTVERVPNEEPAESKPTPDQPAPTAAPAAASTPVLPSPGIAPHVPAPRPVAPAVPAPVRQEPAAPAPAANPAPRLDPVQAEGAAAPSMTGPAGRTPIVADAETPRPPLSAPNDGNPTGSDRPAVPAVQSPAVSGLPAQPAAQPPAPRKLTLEEEMERLLGDFTFDNLIDPPRR